MPDTVVQFINTTGKTYSELIAGVTLASNTSTEQAVVKDVVLTNPNSRTLTLNVGDAVVAETSNAARLAGSELLGASTSLTLKTTSLALWNGFRYFPNNSDAWRDTLPTFFSGSPIPASVSASEQFTSYGSALSADPNFAVIAANGDFYYSNNGGGALYRRAGGISGSQTTITSYGLAGSFDGRYIYTFAAGSNNMAVTDTQNNGSVVQGGYSGMGGISTSTGNSAAIDGYVWVKTQFNEACFLVNASTRVAVPLGGAGSGLDQRYYIGIGRNSSGDYIGIHFDGTGPNVYWFNFGSSLATAFSTQTLKASGSFNANLGNASNSFTNNLFRLPGSTDYLVALISGGSNATIFDLDSVTSPTNTVINNTSLNPTGGKTLFADAAAASSEFGLVNVRATGIKTTP